MRSLGYTGRNYGFVSGLTKRQESVLRGTILGDGGLELGKASVNATLSLLHGEAQKAYLIWKIQELSTLFASTEPKYLVRLDKHGKPHPQWRLRSRAHPLLTAMYNEFYTRPDSECNEHVFKKKLTPVLLATVHADPLAWAAWFADDGFRVSGGSISIIVGAMTQEEYALAGWWWRGQGFDNSVLPERDANAARIRFSAEASHRLIAVLEPHTIPSMRYKFEPAPDPALKPMPYDQSASELLDQGLDRTAIGEKLQLHPSIISRALKRQGRSGTSHAHDPAFEAEVLRMHREGLNQPTIAQRLGTTQPRVGHYLRRNGIGKPLKRPTRWTPKS